nr:type VI secretion system tube protein TssD [Marinicella rhabdoformis]
MAALDAYMMIKVNGGVIQGDVTRTGFEGFFEVNEVHHLIKNSAQTEHKPLILTTRMSKGMPLLFQALDQGSLVDLELKFLRPTNSGQEEHFYTIEIENGKLVAAEPIMLNNNYPENLVHAVNVRLRFDYEKMEITYEDGGETVILTVPQ